MVKGRGSNECNGRRRRVFMTGWKKRKYPGTTIL